MYLYWIRVSVLNVIEYVTGWKVSKYRVVSGPYFPVFGLNTEIYGINFRIQSEYRKIRTRNNSVFGHFSRSVCMCIFTCLYVRGCVHIYICIYISVFSFDLSIFMFFFSFTLFSHFCSELKDDNENKAFLLILCYPNHCWCYSYLFAIIFNFNFHILTFNHFVCLFVCCCFFT